MTHLANQGVPMEMFLGILLMLSALTGASLIAIFFFRKIFQSHHRGPIYS